MDVWIESFHILQQDQIICKDYAWIMHLLILRSYARIMHGLCTSPNCSNLLSCSCHIIITLTERHVLLLSFVSALVQGSNSSPVKYLLYKNLEASRKRQVHIHDTVRLAIFMSPTLKLSLYICTHILHFVHM